MSKSAKPLVLVADDDTDLLRVLEFRLQRWGYRVACAKNKHELLTQLADQTPAALLLDLRFGESDGLEILQELLRKYPSLSCIMLTAHGSIDNAVSAIKLGAFDYLTKPMDVNRLEVTLKHVLDKQRLSERIEQLERFVDEQATVSRPIIGNSVALQRLREEIANVAPTDATVLIIGESGTGKELVARALHEQSRRAAGPFIPMNMAALPRELVESTLFGHEKGAFTGADQAQTGCCEQANGGTLFLDEIGEMDIELQSKLLRFLQEQTVQRVGSSKLIHVNTRIVAATNRDPQALVQAGQLRSDLYFRLNVVAVRLPPLRERVEDIPLLAMRFVQKAATRLGKPVVDFEESAIEALCCYPWPGNVRELENMVERMVIFAKGEQITLDQVPREIVEPRSLESPDPTTLQLRSPQHQPHYPAAWPPTTALPAMPRQHLSHPPTNTPPASTADGEPLTQMEQLERLAIVDALNQSGGHVAEAARILGLGQATVYRKIKRYDIPLDRRRR